MRALYLPSTPRRSSAATRLLEASVQDNVVTDPGSRQHALVNMLTSEFELLLAKAMLLEARPWLADTRTVGAVDFNESLPTTHEDDLLYGIPDRWETALIESYTYSPAGGMGMVQADGQIAAAADIERAVVTPIGLVCQVGTDLFRLTDYNPYGEVVAAGDDGVFGQDWDAFTLASISGRGYTLYQAYDAATVTVNVQTSGLDLIFGGPGVFSVEIEYLASAAVEDGDDLSALTDYDTPLKLYLAGTETAYTVASDVITIPGDEGSTYQLFYTAKHTIAFTTPPLQVGQSALDPRTYRRSFETVAENMYRMVGPEAFTSTQTVHLLGRPAGIGRAVPVDKAGFVGESNVGHTITHVLQSQYHTVVANATTVSLVEHDAEKLVLQQTFPELDIKGLTWTKQGELGLVALSGSALEVHALRNVRRKRSGTWTPAA